MTIQEVLKRVIKAGYKPTFEQEFEWKKGGSIARLVLDPSFWQALGKSMGWQMEREWEGKHWKKYWHRLIDHLAEGKSIESYFEKL